MPRPRARVIHPTRGTDFNALEMQLWPVNVALLILAGFTAGVIIAKSDFDNPNLLYNGWFRLGALAMTVGILMWAAVRLRGKVLMRTQVAVLLALLLHLFQAWIYHEVSLHLIAESNDKPAPKLTQRDKVTLPDYGRPVHQDDPKEDPLEKPVETEPQEEPKQEIEREQPVQQKPTEKPTVKPKQTQSVQPQKVQMERKEISVPRQSETQAGAKLSKQMMKQPTEATQSVSTPKVAQKQTATKSPTETKATNVQRQTNKPAVKSQKVASKQPTTPTQQQKTQLKRQPTRKVEPTVDSPTTPSLTRRTPNMPQLTQPDASSPKLTAKTPTQQPTEPTSKPTEVRRQTNAPTPTKQPSKPTPVTKVEVAQKPVQNQRSETTPQVTQTQPTQTPRKTSQPTPQATAQAQPTPTKAATTPTPTPTQPTKTTVAKATTQSPQASKSTNRPNQLPTTNTQAKATATKRATASQAVAATSQNPTARSPRLTKSRSQTRASTTSSAQVASASVSKPSPKSSALEASSAASQVSRQSKTGPSASKTATASKSAPSQTQVAKAAPGPKSNARSQTTQRNASQSSTPVANKSTANPSTQSTAQAVNVSAPSKAVASANAPSLQASSSQVTKAASSNAPTASGKPNQATKAVAAGSTATAQASQVTRAARASSPAVQSQTPQSSPARSKGAVQAAASTAQADAPAVASGAPSSTPSPAASNTQVTRRTTGTSGATAERNFSHTMPAAQASSQVASAAAARSKASQVDNASNASAPSAPAEVAKAVAGAATPQASLKAQDVQVADATGAQTPSLTESSASAAVQRQAAKAESGKTQAAAGSNAVDVGATQVVADAGKSQGAASRGGGDPSMAQSNQQPKVGRSTPAGEPTAANESAEISNLALAPSSQQGAPGPAVDSDATTATRQNTSAAQPGLAQSNASEVPTGATSGLAESRVAQAARSDGARESAPSEGAGAPLSKSSRQQVTSGAAGAEAEAVAVAEAGGGGKQGEATQADVGDVAKASGSGPAANKDKGESAPAAPGAGEQTTQLAQRSTGGASEAERAQAGPVGSPNLARATSDANQLPGAAEVAEAVEVASSSGAPQTAAVEATAGGLTRAAAPAAASGEPGNPGATPQVAGAESLAGSALARATEGEAAPAGGASGPAAQLARATPAGMAAPGTAVDVPGGSPAPGGTPGENNAKPSGVESGDTTLNRQLAGTPGSPVRRAGDAVAGAPGQLEPGVAIPGSLGGRRQTGEQEDGPEVSGNDPASGLVKRQTGQLGLPTGVAEVDNPGQVAQAEGSPEAGDGLEQASGTELTKREASGLPVQIAAVEGPGGLAANPHLEIGVKTKAQRRSDVVHLSQHARFILEKSLGQPNVTSDADETAPTFSLRNPNLRDKVAEPLGATRESEFAVEMGLDFLARHQNQDGSWSIDRFGEGRYEKDPGHGAVRSDTASTGLALLAFLGAGYHHLEGKHRMTVKNGLDWMVKHQKETGSLYVGGTEGTRFYSHGIASIALCEAYGMTRDPELREPVKKCLQFILESRDPRDGGWRYDPGRETDTSVTGWIMMALKSGELSGFVVPQEAYDGVSKWLDFAQGPDGSPSRYAYLPKKNALREWHKEPSKAMTAESMLMRLYLGWKKDNPNVQDAAEYIRSNLPPTTMHAPGWRDSYYWYYATQVMYHLQGENWKIWNDRLRELLVHSQETEGPLAGSWDHRRDRWGSKGGRMYVTCMHLLMLEVYYRHLPLFQVDRVAGK